MLKRYEEVGTQLITTCESILLSAQGMRLLLSMIDRKSRADMICRTSGGAPEGGRQCGENKIELELAHETGHHTGGATQPFDRCTCKEGQQLRIRASPY